MTAEQLAKALGGKRAGRQWVVRCPAHDDRTPSLIIFDGKQQVQVRCLTGCEPKDIIAVLKAAGRWQNGEAQEPQRDDGAEAARLGDLALAIWDDGVDPRGTLAETYLWQRGLSLPIDCSALRFHQRCPRGHDRWPALIAVMTDLNSKHPVAIQRIYLKPDATKDGALMLGPAHGAAMKLTPHYATFNDDLLHCPRLHVCEGLETGLALLQQGFKRVWALGSCGAIERLPVLFGVSQLVVCADNDPPGLSAAMVCINRWNAAPHPILSRYGRAVIRTSVVAGHDFADDVAEQVHA